MIRNLLLFLFLVLGGLGGGYIWQEVNPVAEAPKQRLDTPAFVAEMGKAVWVINLQPGYFKPSVKSVSIKYNKVLYGIFLTTDKIYLPILDKRTKLVMTGLDENGIKVSRNEYTMERK